MKVCRTSEKSLTFVRF